jgi:hypothetical protein
LPRRVNGRPWPVCNLNRGVEGSFLPNSAFPNFITESQRGLKGVKYDRQIHAPQIGAEAGFAFRLGPHTWLPEESYTQLCPDLYARVSRLGAHLCSGLWRLFQLLQRMYSGIQVLRRWLPQIGRAIQAYCGRPGLASVSRFFWLGATLFYIYFFLPHVGHQSIGLPVLSTQNK